MGIIETLESRRLLAVYDPTFGDGGVTAFPDTQLSLAIAAQSDGKTLIAMRVDDGIPNLVDAAAVIGRVNADGSVDTTFGGGDGVAEADVADDDTNEVEVHAIAQQGSNILVLLSVRNENHLDLLRLTSAGARDTSFGDNGQIRIDSFSGNSPTLRLLANGDIAVAASSADHLLLARYQADGSPDTTLAPDGVKRIAIDSLPALDDGRATSIFDTAIAIDDDGSVAVIAIHSDPGSVTPQLDIAPRIAMFTPAGALDTTFSSDGVADDLDVLGYSLEEFAFDDAHRLVVAGSHLLLATRLDVSVPIMARFMPDGSLDDSFDDDGIYAPGHGFGGDAHRLVIAPDGDIITLTNFSRLHRFAPDGTPRAGYGPGGLQLGQGLTTEGITIFTPIDVAFDSAGNIVVALHKSEDFDTPARAAVARIADNPISHELSFENLQVAGADGDDVITISENIVDELNATLVITHNGDTATYNRRDIDFASIVLAGGDDHLTADLLGFDDETFFDSISCAISGGDGDDTIIAGDSFDSIYGEPGDDLLMGRGADDQLEGGEGNDTLDGGDGRDYLAGGTGNDKLYGRAGGDRLWGYVGADLLSGGGGSDSMAGGGGYDRLYGGNGNDHLDGGAHRDRLFGHAGNDGLSGGYDTDVLDGGDGDDLFTDSDGFADTMFGGAGDDTAPVIDDGLDVLDEIETT